MEPARPCAERLLRRSTGCEGRKQLRRLDWRKRESAIEKLPMAGLEPARAFYGPTDFKSVASTIPPHRRCAAHSMLFFDRENQFRSCRSVIVISPTLPESLAPA